MEKRVIREIGSDRGSNKKTLLIPICFSQPTLIDYDKTHTNTMKNLRHKSNTIFVGFIDDEDHEHRGIDSNDIENLLDGNFSKKCKNHNVKIYLSGHADTSYFELNNEEDLFEILKGILLEFSVKSIILDSCHTADSFEKNWLMEKIIKWTTPPYKNEKDAKSRLDRLNIGQENLAKRFSKVLAQNGFYGIKVTGFRGEVYHSRVDQHENKSSKYSRYCTFFRGHNETVKVKSSDARIVYEDGECIEHKSQYKDIIKNEDSDTLYAYKI